MTTQSNESTTPQITAELHNYQIITYEDYSYAVGNIRGDTKNRFGENERVHTSAIDRIEGDIMYTKYSVYKLVGEAKA